MKEQTSVPQQSPAVAAEQRDRIARRLVGWYRAHKRDLPWRGASAYAVWISEIMLQQTQVATVIPFFLRFMTRFPTVESLAAAPIDDVLQQWAGLGYYARARNLHRAAQNIVAEHGGHLPDSIEAITALPGIGRYTAGAILSIAYNRPLPIVDANVIRVLSRLYGLRGDPKSTPNQAALWSLAEQLVPEDCPGDFNQGLMELGALICRPDDPLCEQCPLLSDCVAGNSPDPTTLPEYPPGRASVAVTHSSAILAREGDSSSFASEFLVVQRPLHGLWGGLWEFPRVVCDRGEPPEDAAIRAGREVVGIEAVASHRVGVVKHGVTHHRITLHGFLAVAMPPGQIAYPLACAAVRWAPIEELESYAFSSPQTLLRHALKQHLGKTPSGHDQPALELWLA